MVHIGIGIFIICLIIKHVAKVNNQRKEKLRIEEATKRREEEIKRREEEQAKKEKERRAKYVQERKEILNSLVGRTIREVCEIPDNITFDSSNLPHDNNDNLYGSFTIYLTKTGKKYHNRRGCCSAQKPIHIFRAIEQHYEPCTKCCSKPMRIPKWYNNYKELLLKLRSYDIKFDSIDMIFTEDM